MYVCVCVGGGGGGGGVAMCMSLCVWGGGGSSHVYEFVCVCGGGGGGGGGGSSHVFELLALTTMFQVNAVTGSLFTSEIMEAAATEKKVCCPSTCNNRVLPLLEKAV